MTRLMPDNMPVLLPTRLAGAAVEERLAAAKLGVEV